MDEYQQTPFSVDFDLEHGFSSSRYSTKRLLSQMKGIFNDTNEVEAILNHEGDKLIYEFYELGLPQNSGELQFGTSIVYPGKVGKEYNMTKGHFHEVLETAEVYYTLQGGGYMLMETPEGEWKAEPLEKGKALYVPPRWAHRSINTSKKPLITFFVFRGDAGHDYGTIETKGFRKLIVEGENGQPEIIDNPAWIKE